MTDGTKWLQGRVHERLDSMTDAGLAVDATGTALLLNARAAGLLGYAPQGLAGVPLPNLHAKTPRRPQLHRPAAASEQPLR